MTHGPPHTGDSWVCLKDAAKIYSGINLYAAHKRPASDEKEPEKERVGIVNLPNVKNGKLHLDNLHYHSIPTSRLSSVLIQPGDILISNRGVGIKVCLVPADCEKLALSSVFFGLRLDRSKYDPLFVYRLFVGPAGQAALAEMQICSSTKMLRAKDLKELQLPKISLEKQMQYVREVNCVEEDCERIERQLFQRRCAAYNQFYEAIGFQPDSGLSQISGGITDDWQMSRDRPSVLEKIRKKAAEGKKSRAKRPQKAGSKESR